MVKSIRLLVLISALAIVTLALAACAPAASTTTPTAPAATPTRPAAAPTTAGTSAAPTTAASPAATRAAVTPAASATAAGGAAGNPTAGQAVFASNCNACHPNGGAGVGPDIRGTSASEVKTVVRNGKGSMPAFSTSQISDQQLNDLAAYVSSLSK